MTPECRCEDEGREVVRLAAGYQHEVLVAEGTKAICVSWTQRCPSGQHAIADCGHVRRLCVEEERG